MDDLTPRMVVWRLSHYQLMLILPRLLQIKALDCMMKVTEGKLKMATLCPDMMELEL